MRQREALFQVAVLKWLGVEDIPGMTPPGPKQVYKELGEACRGTNIPTCERYFNVKGEALRWVHCWHCKGVERS